MIQARFLQTGSTIAIVAPSGVIAPEVVENGIKWLHEQGFQLRIGNHILNPHYQFAAEDSQRLADLQAAMNDPNVDAILAARGGYGMMRIMDKLDFTSFLRFPKWFCGFSDITAMHLLLNQLQVKSIHSCMLACLNNQAADPRSSNKLMQVLQGKFPDYQGETSLFSRPGLVSAELIGGNLSLIHALRGTPYEPSVKGKILFIEEIGEYLYHIDRMLLNLKLGGWFEDIAGLVVGHFSNLKDHDLGFGKSFREIIVEYTAHANYPVLFDFPAGHEDHNLPLVFGQQTLLEVSSVGWRLNQNISHG